MLLMKVVPDETMAVVGFERRTFMCSCCHDVERRFAFAKPTAESDALPVHTAPSIIPESEPHFAPARAASGHARIAPVEMLRRIFARLRGR